MQTRKPVNNFKGELMKVISVLGQKGGSGKTTLTLSLAVAAYKANQSVAVIDLDPQASACKWGDRRSGDPVIISVQPARLHTVLSKARENGADLVLIDTPARLEQSAIAAAEAADLILIPCRPTIKDTETIEATISLIRAARTKAKVAAVLNGVPPRGAQREQAEDAIRSMTIPVYPFALGNRVAFTHADVLGLSAQEYEPSGEGAREIKQIYKFTCELLNSKTAHQSKESKHGKKTRPAASA
ncbi:MAG: ParA family protein [Candidatus Acidiferrales bacterium]